MIKILAIGRPTAEVTLQKSKDGKSEFISFSLAVNEGYGDFAYTEYLECYSTDSIAPRIVNAKVNPKSLIWIDGTLKTKEYDRKKKDKSDLVDEFGNKVKGHKLQVRITDWGYVPIPKSEDSKSDEKEPNCSNGTQNNQSGDDELPY